VTAADPLREELVKLARALGPHYIGLIVGEVADAQSPSAED